MITPFRYPVTLIFCLHEVEVMIKSDKRFMDILKKHRYEYKYFLEDYLCFFFKEYLFISFITDISQERERLYLSFLSGLYFDEQENFIIHNTISKITNFCYRVWKEKIPVIQGYSEYQLDYRDKTNSFFFLFLI